MLPIQNQKSCDLASFYTNFAAEATAIVRSYFWHCIFYLLLQGSIVCLFVCRPVERGRWLKHRPHSTITYSKRPNDRQYTERQYYSVRLIWVPFIVSNAIVIKRRRANKHCGFRSPSFGEMWWPRILILPWDSAGHSLSMWMELSESSPHRRQVGSSISPMTFW